MFSDPKNNIQQRVYGRVGDSHREYAKSVESPAGVGPVNLQPRDSSFRAPRTTDGEISI